MSKGFAAIREEGGSGEFTVIKEGKPVVVHLLGEPEKKVTHWAVAGKDSVACTGPGCIACVDTDKWKKPAKTWAVKVFNLSTMKQETMQKGWTVISPILETWEALGKDLSGVDFRISVQGSGMESTKYTVINIPTKFTPDMIVDESPLNEEEHP